MAKPCDLKSHEADIDAVSSKAAVTNYIEQKLNDFMGTEAEIAATLADGKNAAPTMKAWQESRKSLVGLLVENMEIVGAEHYRVDDYIVLLEDYLQGQFGSLGGKKLFVDAPHRRILAASKLLNKLTKLHQTRYGKLLNKFERALFPVNFFARRIDRFGFISKYILQATNLVEDSKRSGSRFKARLKQSHAGYLQTVQNILGSLDHIPKDFVMDGVEMRTSDNVPVMFLGSQKDDNGLVTHTVLDLLDEKKKVLGKDSISKAGIIRAISNKYAFEFSNDVMAGQARNITWRDTPTQDDRDEISFLLKKLKFKLDQVAFSNEGAKEDLSQGINGLYETTHRGTRYTYVIIKDTKKIVDKETGEVISEKPALDQNFGEAYSGYLVRTVDPTGKGVNFFSSKFELESKVSVERLSKQRGTPFKNGWHKAKEQKVFGKRVHKNSSTQELFNSETDNEKGFNFDSIQTTFMQNQPADRLIFGRVSRPTAGISERTAETSREFKTFWKMTQELRRTYNEIGDEILSESQAEQDQLQEWVTNKLPGLMDKTGKVMKKADVNKYFEGLNSMFGLNKRFYMTRQGEIITPNAQFMKIRGNYVPFLYESADIVNMQEDAIEQVQVKLSRAKEGTEKHKRLTERLDQLRLSLARIIDDQEQVQTLTAKLETDPSELINKQVVADRSVYTKHREEWTDTTLRKKDPELIDNYIDSIYYNLTKNRLMLSMLNNANTILQSKMPDTQKQDLMFWISNRSKIALNDPSAWAGIGKLDYSYSRIAKAMNKWIPGRREWDEESVRKMINFSKGSLSAMLLGAPGAMTNRTQIVNPAITAGWDMVWRTGRILRGKDEAFSLDRANAIISHVGTDEITNMLEDSLSHGGDLTLADAGLISTPFFRLPIPTQTWADFLGMIRRNRNGFIENGIPEVDLMLKRIEFDRIQNIKKRQGSKEMEILSQLKSWDKAKVNSTLRVLNREYERVTSPSERRNIEELRENYLNLLMTPKADQSSKALRLKYKKIMGEVTENRMRRIVGWKLGWWWEGFAPELFTFTESERFMRKQVVLMALLNAAEAGQLGKIDASKKTNIKFIDKKTGKALDADVPDIFLTDEAVRIARNAVSDTMFGMSMNNLGEAFGGFGAQLGLYKAYPLNQMIHDFKILETYMAGNVTKVEAMQRLGTAFGHYLKVFAERVSTGKKFEYDPGAPGMDHEAIAMVRFLMSRVAMSAVSIFTELFTIMRSVFKTPISQQFNAMIRGGENPVIGLMLRLGTNALIMATLDPDDDDNDNMLDVGWDFFRLVLPVFLTLPMHIITQWTAD